MLEQSLIRGCHCNNGGAIETNLVVASNSIRCFHMTETLSNFKSDTRLMAIQQVIETLIPQQNLLMLLLNAAENDQSLDAPIQHNCVLCLSDEIM